MAQTQDFEQVVDTVRKGVKQLLATVDNMLKVLESKNKATTTFLAVAPGGSSDAAYLVEAKANRELLSKLKNTINTQLVIAEVAKADATQLKANS